MNEGYQRPTYEKALYSKDNDPMYDEKYKAVIQEILKETPTLELKNMKKGEPDKVHCSMLEPYIVCRSFFEVKIKDVPAEGKKVSTTVWAIPLGKLSRIVKKGENDEDIITENVQKIYEIAKKHRGLTTLNNASSVKQQTLTKYAVGVSTLHNMKREIEKIMNDEECTADVHEKCNRNLQQLEEIQATTGIDNCIIHTRVSIDSRKRHSEPKKTHNSGGLKVLTNGCYVEFRDCGRITNVEQLRETKKLPNDESYKWFNFDLFYLNLFLDQPTSKGNLAIPCAHSAYLIAKAPYRQKETPSTTEYVDFAEMVHTDNENF